MPGFAGLSPAHLSLAFVGLFWMLPFLQPVHRLPLPTFYSEWLAFVLGLVALGLLATKRAWQDGRLPTVMFFPLGLAALILLQAAFGRVPYVAQALTATLYLVWAALLIVLGWALRRELGMPTVATALAWFLVAGGTLNAIVAVVQYYGFSTVFDPLITPAVGAIYGNIAQRNHLATYLVLALASVAYLFVSGRMRGAIVVVVAMPLVSALGFTTSRSAWLYLGAVLVLGLFFRVRYPDGRGKRLLVFVGLLVIGFAVDQWLMTLPFFLPASGDAGPASGDVVTATQRIFAVPGISIRLQHARTAWWVFMQAPFLGAGWGQFAWYDFEYKALFGVGLVPQVTTNAHNLVTQLLAETGLAGALLVTGGALLWLWDLRKRAFDFEHWWLLALVAVSGIQNMLEFPLWHSHFLGVSAIMLGLGASRDYVIRLQRLGPPAMALLLAAGFFNALTLWYSYRDFEQAFALRSPGLPPSKEFAAILSRRQNNPVLEPHIEFIAADYIMINRDQLQDKLDLNGRAMRFFPANIIVYRQALLLAMDGQVQAAQDLFVRAMRVYPSMLPRITMTLRELAALYPAEFAPLLELATAKPAEQRAPHAVK